MANVKISGLPTASTPLTGAELVPVVQSGVTSQTTVSDFGAAVSYTPSGTGAVATTVQTKLRETVSVKDFGAVGNGTTDDTAAIQAAITAGAGKQVYIPAGTYKISTTINVSSSTYVYGDGLGITFLSATTAMTNLQPVFYANNANYVRFENFSILGNTNGTLGAGTGIHCKTGIGNEIKGVYISNTTQAGIRLEEQNTAWVDSCWLESCGRSGYTDNHGIMFYSSAGSTVANYAIKITNNTVKNSYRKGITNYGPNADIYDILIDGNTVKGSGLGNIYVGTDYSKNFTITNNYCYGGYVNMQIGALASSIISNNVLDYSTGAFNIGCFGLTSCVISGNTIKNSAACGFTFISPAGELNIKNIFSNNVVMNSRQVTTGAPAIDLLATTNNIFDSNIVFDETAANSNYGIYENTGSDYNQITNNKILNMTNTSYRILGSNTMLLDIKAGSVFNFDSGLQVKQTSLTLATVTNNNVALPAKTGVATVSYSGQIPGTVTMTIASPCVITFTGNSLVNGDKVVFTTTGALPTGLTAGTTYYVINAASNTFNVSATPGGAAINTSGIQSGTHTCTPKNEITGLTGGLLGRTIRLVNDTAYDLTLKINSGSSTAGNRFYLTGGVDKTISAYSSVALTYVTTQGNNFWTDA